MVINNITREELVAYIRVLQKINGKNEEEVSY